MLRQIITTFETSPGPISLDALARRLGVDRALLEPMLAELVRMGRLVRLDGRAAAACTACGHANGCPFILSIAGAYFALPASVAEMGLCS